MKSNIRGFVFTIDMLYGSLTVLLLLSTYVYIQQSTIENSHALLLIAAKDKTMAWFYGDAPSTPSISPGKPFACDVGFRPDVNTSFLDPSFPGSWNIQQNCVVSP